MSDAGWLMRIEGGLSAHFTQPDGPSLPGTDWTVGLKRGEENYKAIVRAIVAPQASERARGDTEYQARVAMQYLNDCLAGGWHPREARHHEIFVADPPAQEAPTEPPAAPWWKIW